MKQISCKLLPLIIHVWINYATCLSISPDIAGGNLKLQQDLSNGIHEAREKLIQPQVTSLAGLNNKPLRQHSKAPEINRLDAGVEFGKGSLINMWCNIGLKSTQKIDECQFTSPDDTSYLLRNDKVYKYNENSNTTDWWESVDPNIIIIMPKDKQKCKISIYNAKEKDVGKWSCKVVLSESHQFQSAILTIPSREAGQQKYPLIRDVRLPTSLIPEKYNVYLTPFIIKDNYTIEGHVDITIKVMDATNKVTLHIKDIKIYENTVRVENKKVIGHGYDAPREFYIIYLADDLIAGSTYKISIDFLANLNDDLSGFYRSSYYDCESGTTKFMAVSDFEAPDARRALPCFDEPDKKAVFQVNLGRTKEMTSISNMPQILNSLPMSDNDEYVWDVYEDSVKMSTYLLAFVVSEFEFRQSNPTKNDVRFRIWSRKEAISQTHYAADIGPKILEYYETYFGVPYPLPKQDMIAIPDFSAGAMENWGLITYRETALLYEDGVTSAQGKEYIRTVIAHELAHQWFGNLVTMKWWTE